MYINIIYIYIVCICVNINYQTQPVGILSISPRACHKQLKHWRLWPDLDLVLHPHWLMRAHPDGKVMMTNPHPHGKHAVPSMSWFPCSEPAKKHQKLRGNLGGLRMIEMGRNQVGHNLPSHPSWTRSSSGTGVVGTAVTSGSSPVSQIVRWDRISYTTSQQNWKKWTWYYLWAGSERRSCGQVVIWMLVRRKQIVQISKECYAEIQRMLCLRKGLMVPIPS